MTVFWIFGSHYFENNSLLRLIDSADPAYNPQ